MSLSRIEEVEEQVQKYWAPRFTKRLTESLLLGGLVNKEYQGEIRQGGDEVTVSQINALDGEVQDASVDTFNAEKVSTSFIKIKADKRAVAAYKFTDLVSLQSQIDADSQPVREALTEDIERQINKYLYSLVAPSSSTPDHELTGEAAMTAAKLLAIRNLAAAARWRKEGGWWMLAGTKYYGDMLGDAVLASMEYGAGDAPAVGGQVSLPRYGFNILEDNSRDGSFALAFHPDFMHMVSQTEVRVKISDLHSNQQFGVLMSVDLIFGAALGINGDVKHITQTS